MAGLVAAEGLVGEERFVADCALVREFQGRWLRRRLLMSLRVRGGSRFTGGSGRYTAFTATGEHDEAEGKVLFLRRWVLNAGSFGALPLRPWLHVLTLDVFFIIERSGCGGRIQCFQGHLETALLRE